MPYQDLNRLLVGPSFCGKTYLLKKLKLFRLRNSKHIRIVTRSPEQYEHLSSLILYGTMLKTGGGV